MKLSTVSRGILYAFCALSFIVSVVCATGSPGTQGGAYPFTQDSNSQKYTIDQTLSDRGQESTIAFDGLAFLTGDACSDTFLPPGKVADYAGFQFLRDNDATQMGHNTDFVTRISDNVLYILNDDQLHQFATLAQTEAPLSVQYAYMRYPLATAFRDNLDGTIPPSSNGLDKTAVMQYSARLYDVDANISIARATTYANVIRSLNQTQRAYLDTLKKEGMAAMPDVDPTSSLKSNGYDASVAMRTYASEMFAWYAGSVEADTYFCPERQATYFGSFYMKDRPAMGNSDYSISTSLTGDSGQDFLNLLTPDQRTQITSLVDLQRSDLNGIVAKRTAIATELRKALDGESIDDHVVHNLSEQYGSLDGEISYLYATHFAAVKKTLTSDQMQKMVALRNLDNYTCSGAYLYSQPVSMPQNIPSDFLLSEGMYNTTQMSEWLTGLQTASSGIAVNPQDKSTSSQKNSFQNTSGDHSTQGEFQNRMPVEQVIASIQQQGYDVSGVQSAVQSNDHDAMKAWMKEFKQNHPGVAEAIEGSASPNPATQQTFQEPRESEDLLHGLWDWLWGGTKNTPFSAHIISPSALTPEIQTNSALASGSFILSTNASLDGKALLQEYTCDGAGSSPALSWSGAPAETKEFALMMTTVPVDGSTRWNWVLYHIPQSARGLLKNGSAIGILGTGSHGTIMKYDPPCSQGPGPKTYTFTLYALSASPVLPENTSQVTGPVLTSAIAPVTLETASFNLSYTRST